MLYRRWLSVLVSLMVVAGLFLGCSSHQDVWEGKGGPPRVVVTFPPLVSFVKGVAGDHAAIISLCTNTGPHGYEYNVKEIIGLRKADLFLANGLELDNSFADKLYLNVSRPKLPYVKIGEDLPKTLLLAAHDEEEEKAGGDHKHEHKHGIYDPHIWLGIPQAKAMVEKIRDALIKTDPENEKEYTRNTTKYLKKLDSLKETGDKLLKNKKIKLVSFHDSLGYFAKTYGVEIVDVIEVAPGDTPTGKKLEDLVTTCIDKKIKIIAVEPQFPKSSADVLQKELKKKKLEVELIVIDPLETVDEKDTLNDDWYIGKMTENLENLAKAVK